MRFELAYSGISSTDVFSLGTDSLSQLASARYCIAMVTCMLTCKSGYQLGKTSDENGCQSCICVKPSGKGKVIRSICCYNSNNSSSVI